MLERRKSQRQKCFLRGLIDFAEQHGKMACLVRDISDGGARVCFSCHVAIPERLNLYIPQRQKTVRVQVRWRRGDEFGVSFLDEAADSTAGRKNELLQRIVRLEIEAAALKDTIKRLKCEGYAAADCKDRRSANQVGPLPETVEPESN